MMLLDRKWGTTDTYLLSDCKLIKRQELSQIPQKNDLEYFENDDHEYSEKK